MIRGISFLTKIGNMLCFVIFSNPFAGGAGPTTPAPTREIFKSGPCRAGPTAPAPTRDMFKSRAKARPGP